LAYLLIGLPGFAMLFWRMFVVAYKNLLTNKRRSFLTMLGIIIGVMAVVLVMSVGAGAQSLILDQIQQRGTDQIAVLPGSSDPTGPPAQVLGIIITTLTYEDGQALLLKNNVQHLKEVAAYLSGSDVFQWEAEERNVTYTGATASYTAVEKIAIADGRFFSEAEEQQGDHVIVIGATIAKEVFGNQDPVGEFVKLKRKRFKVIGVMAEKGTSLFENPDESVVIPLLVAQRELLAARHVSFLRMQVDDEKYIDQTIEEIRQTLVERHNDEDFSIRNIADALDILTTITNALKFFLVAVAAVALFVGGVGIMNIMLIAVKEKTREIGLRKAVGAREKHILWQFLIETFVIVFVGAVVGVVLGILVSFIIALIVQAQGYTYRFIVSSVVLIIAVGVSLVIGLVFGIVPARKASKLDPIDALRYE